MTTVWTDDAKPSVLTDPIWASDRFLWDSTKSTYIEFPWVYVPTNIWTNDSEGA